MAAGGNTACVEVVAGDTRIILVQLLMWNAQLSAHPLLLRAEEGTIFAMNPLTGLDHAVASQDLSSHLAAPVAAGPQQFAGGIYLDSGIVLRVNR